MSELNVDAVFDSMKGDREENSSERRDEASDLEKAEMLLLEIEEGKITKEEKYSNIINAVYSITNACAKELDSNNPVCEKYGMLHTGIPIQMRENTSPAEKINYANIRKTEKKVENTLLELMRGRIVMNLQGQAVLDADQEAFFDYVFSLAYISLKKIFKEVKAEIMGK